MVYSSVDYDIDRGGLSFNNPADFDPEVDLLATTRGRDFDVTLTLGGTMVEVFELLSTGGDEELESNTVRRADEIGQDQSSRLPLQEAHRLCHAELRRDTQT